MKLLETVLMTTDFGNGLAPSMDATLSLAKKFGSKLVLLHVIPEELLPYLSDEADLTDVARRLREIGKKIEASGLPGPEIVVRKGVPSEVICEEAGRREVNVIVLGSGVRDSGGRCRPGVTAERVIRRATTPVWIARPGGDPEPRRILCPTDMSRASRRALKNALVLCRKFNAKLTVLTVHEPLPHVYGSMPGFSKQIHRDDQAAERAGFEKFLARSDMEGVDYTSKVRSGNAHKEIVSEALESKADLLTMGTIGKTNVERILIGSVTQKVLRELPCPLLVMKEEDVVRLSLDSAMASVEEHFKQGQELLQSGMAQEALHEFDQCLLAAPTFAVAWEGKAAAYYRLGDTDNAKSATAAAKRIRNELWQRRVEAEVRGQHELLGRKRKAF